MTTTTATSPEEQTMRTFTDFYIDGKWVPSTGSTTSPIVNPATDEEIAQVVLGTPEDADAAVQAAHRAFPAWSATPAAERSAYLAAVAEQLVARSEELAQLITEEMGSTIAFSRAIQVPLAINSFAKASEMIKDYAFEHEYRGSTIVREPYGVVAAIAPWNYPLHLVSLKVAYALAAGNTMVVKPSEMTPLDAFVLAEIMDSVGLPPGVFNLVSGTGQVVGEALVSHPLVDAVTFTGSTRAGRRIAELAASTVKRVSLELGGKSPNVVLDDADLSVAIPRAVADSMVNSGQTCSALTRLIVPRDALAEVEALVSEVVGTLTVGDPTQDSTVIGPLASRTQQRRVLDYVRTGIDEGARVVVGGSLEVSEKGAYVQPTVFSDVTTDMTIHREEIFGPVLVIEAYDTEDEALSIANDTVYGLAGGVWSSSSERAHRVARKIRAGQVQINDGDFNPDAPFGGYKQSGVGREAGGFGLEEFLETKSLQG